MFAGRASGYLGACVTDQSHDDVIAAVAEVYGCFIGRGVTGWSHDGEHELIPHDDWTISGRGVIE